MCDTMVATGAAIARGHGTLFAKNSDRQPNEAQVLKVVARRRHRPGSTAKLTYIEIPQVAETNAVLLSRPFWIWGAEMGGNDHGVAIGNEAVFARVPSGRKPGMIGMDLLRLGLERGDSARQSLDVMIELLEQYGQSGNCGHVRRQFYDNSFIIADCREAFVLETFGRHWAVEDVSRMRTISNALSIGTGHARVSDGLGDLARAKGWHRGSGRLDFAASFSDPVREAPGQGRARCARSTEMLRERNAPLRVEDMKTVLRDHRGVDAATWRPDMGTDRTICMHAHPSVGRRGQTTAAMVSELRAGGAVHWVTGTAAPCTSIFKPVLLELGLPDRRRKATDDYDPRSLWWSHERLHRAMLRDFPDRMAAIAQERDALEADMRKSMTRAVAYRGPDAERVRREAIDACWAAAARAEAKWRRQLARRPVAKPASAAYRRGWARLDRAAGFLPLATRGTEP
jgi:secernin